jgi:hypothetical protein
MKESNIIIRIDNELKERLKIAAKKESLPMSKLVLKLVTEYLNVEPQKENVYTNQNNPIKAPKPKKAIKPTEQPKQPVKTAKNSIYSTVRRPNAKNSPDRVVLKF